MTWEVAVGIGFFSIIFTFAYLAVNMDVRNGAIKLFFMFLCIMMMYPLMAIMIHLAAPDAAIESAVAATYSVFIWVMPVTMVLFLMSFLWTFIAEQIKAKKAKKVY